MSDIIIVNLDAGSYLRMMPEKALAKAEKEKKDFYSYGLLCGRNTRSGGLRRAEEVSRVT